MDEEIRTLGYCIVCGNAITDDIDEYFYLSGNYNSGKCKITVTAKYKGQTCSDTFSLKVKSTLKKKLHVLGELYSYNTRSNTFKMSVFNRSKKKIIIYHASIYLYHCQ